MSTIEDTRTLMPLVERVLPLLSTSISSSPERVLRVARSLPATPRALLEVRLGNNYGQTDLSQCFKPEDRLDLKNWVRAHKGRNWSGFKQFVKKLNTQDHIYKLSITDIGMEFDLPTSDPWQLPFPNLFFRVHRDAADEASRQLLKSMFVQILDDFFDQKSTSTLMRCVQSTIDALPQAAQPTYCGLMLARTNRALRLQFSGLHFSSISKYLRDIGIVNIPTTLNDAITLSSRYFSSTVVCLDLTPLPTPRIGLELFRSDLKQGRSIDEFMSHLVERKLCTAPQKQALEQWPGYMDPGPLQPIWAEQESHGREKNFLMVRRQLTHFKILLAENSPLQVKAYLEFRRCIVPLSPLKELKPEYPTN